MKDISVAHSNGTFAIEPSKHTDARVLAANTAKSHNVPAGAQYVIFSATGNFYAKWDGAATVPNADVTNGTASELNPTVRCIGGVKTIGLIAPQDTIITMSFFK